MKLFQIEEPEGSDVPLEGSGVAVGMAAMPGGGAVALAVGGNAEILARQEASGTDAEHAAPTALLLVLRGRAEKMLARPVTHAVIAWDGESTVLQRAAEEAGLAILRIVATAEAAKLAPGADAADAPALGAAIQAEDDVARLPPR